MGFGDRLRSRTTRTVMLAAFLCCLQSADVLARKTIEITLERAVEIAMENSYRVRRLEMNIERTRLILKARQAQLKSSVHMDIKAPQLELLSDYKWNSVLQRDEIVRQNTRLIEMELSVSQPVILFGHPTNGYLSLNSRTYRYGQKKTGENEVMYYNRYFARFRQPILQPNFLRNDIREAELDLERENLAYIDDQVGLIDDVGDDYYDLFDRSYRSVIYANQVEHLERILDIAEAAALEDSAREIEYLQAQVELGVAREQLLRNRARYRLEMERFKERLGLRNGETLSLSPKLAIHPLAVNTDEAIRLGLSSSPRLRMSKIDKIQREISLDNTKGKDAFHLNLELTYGMEKQDEIFGDLWSQYDNSYSVSLTAHIPIWDWGRRKALIAAGKLSVERSELASREIEHSIRSDILGAIENLREYQARALTMAENLEKAKAVTEASIEKYEQDRLAFQDLMRTLSLESKTGLSYLNAYLDYRRAILSLMIHTCYDFENDRSLFESLRGAE